MIRVASLFLPHLAIERLRRIERPRALPEPARQLVAPVDDDPGACSVPRGGSWRPGARWANGAEARARAATDIASLPTHQQPPMRELGRRSEAAEHPFKAMRLDDGGSRRTGALPALTQPLAIAPMVMVATVGQREIVTAACPQAIALGLTSGMSATQARAFIADLDVQAADPDGDIRWLRRLALHAVRHWSPLADPAPPDGIWVELTGTAHLFGGEASFCHRVLQFCQRLGFTARIAIAGTPGAAHALARFAPSAITTVATGDEAQALAPLPLAALRLSDDALSAAGRFGFERIADLVALPRAPLAKRLGLAAIERLDQALGRTAEPLAGVVPFEPPTAARRLLEPIGTAESFSHVIGDLTDDLAERLREGGNGARALVLALLRIDGSEQRVVVGLARASREAVHIGRLLRLRIDQIDPGTGVEEMRLTATRVETLHAVELSGPLAGNQNADLAPLVDILGGRIGTHQIFKASACESDVPERAVERCRPLAAVHGWSRWRRPSRLLRRPEVLQNVVALLPDHPPRRFSWRGETHVVVAGDGPERIHGEWWRRDGEIWAVRDYYQVEDEVGARFWIFRRGDGVDTDTGDLSWHIHGVFG